MFSLLVNCIKARTSLKLLSILLLLVEVCNAFPIANPKPKITPIHGGAPVNSIELYEKGKVKSFLQLENDRVENSRQLSTQGTGSGSSPISVPGAKVEAPVTRVQVFESGSSDIYSVIGSPNSSANLKNKKKPITNPFAPETKSEGSRAPAPGTPGSGSLPGSQLASGNTPSGPGSQGSKNGGGNSKNSGSNGGKKRPGSGNKGTDKGSESGESSESGDNEDSYETNDSGSQEESGSEERQGGPPPASRPQPQQYNSPHYDDSDNDNESFSESAADESDDY